MPKCKPGLRISALIQKHLERIEYITQFNFMPETIKWLRIDILQELSKLTNLKGLELDKWIKEQGYEYDREFGFYRKIR